MKWPSITGSLQSLSTSRSSVTLVWIGIHSGSYRTMSLSFLKRLSMCGWTRSLQQDPRKQRSIIWSPHRWIISLLISPWHPWGDLVSQLMKTSKKSSRMRSVGLSIKLEMMSNVPSICWASVSRWQRFSKPNLALMTQMSMCQSSKRSINKISNIRRILYPLSYWIANPGSLLGWLFFLLRQHTSTKTTDKYVVQQN